MAAAAAAAQAARRAGPRAATAGRRPPQSSAPRPPRMRAAMPVPAARSRPPPRCGADGPCPTCDVSIHRRTRPPPFFMPPHRQRLDTAIEKDATVQQSTQGQAWFTRCWYCREQTSFLFGSCHHAPLQGYLGMRQCCWHSAIMVPQPSIWLLLNISACWSMDGNPAVQMFSLISHQQTAFTTSAHLFLAAAAGCGQLTSG